MAGVIIVAGGSGRRFGSEVPKQFALFFKQPLLAYTLSAFERCAWISEIIVVVHQEFIARAEKLCKDLSFRKIRAVTSGGASRQLSVWNGLQQIRQSGKQKILVHDAARPFVSVDLILRVINGLEKAEAVVPVLKCSDSLLFSSPEELRYLQREQYLLVQTPQGFRTDILLRAHQEAVKNKYFEAADDCSLVQKYLQLKPALVEGEITNFKITYQQDLNVITSLVNDILRLNSQ